MPDPKTPQSFRKMLLATILFGLLSGGCIVWSVTVFIDTAVESQKASVDQMNLTARMRAERDKQPIREGSASVEELKTVHEVQSKKTTALRNRGMSWVIASVVFFGFSMGFLIRYLTLKDPVQHEGVLPEVRNA